MQALRSAGVSPRAAALRRGIAYLRRLQRTDGGFPLVAGRASDAQSTAWAIQALVAAGREPGRDAFRYLARLRRQDGSYRYSRQRVSTPVWVTAQVLPALARDPFP
jgi:prenyltransferase beta subunit